MSAVTNILILGMPISDRPVVAEIQAWLKGRKYEGDPDKYPELVEISCHAGGTKHFESGVWATAVNYLDREAFDAFLGTLSSEMSESFRLMVKGPYDTQWSDWPATEKKDPDWEREG